MDVHADRAWTEEPLCDACYRVLFGTTPQEVFRLRKASESVESPVNGPAPLVTAGARTTGASPMPAGKPSHSHLSPEYQAYINSPEWRAKADAAKARAGHRCQLCNRDGPLDAHHRTYERFGGGELPEDLTVLCRGCHEHFHDGRKPLSRPKGKKVKGTPGMLPSEAKKRIKSAVALLVEGRPYTVGKIATQAGVPKHMAHRPLQELAARGAIRKTKSKRWMKDVPAERQLASAVERAVRRKGAPGPEIRLVPPPGRESKSKKRAASVRTIAQLFIDSPSGTVFTAEEIVVETGLSIACVNAAIGSMNVAEEIVRVGHKGWKQAASVEALTAIVQEPQAYAA